MKKFVPCALTVVFLVVVVVAPLSADDCVGCNILQECVTKEDAACECEVQYRPLAGGLFFWCKASGFCATVGPNFCPGDPGFPEELRTESHSNQEMDLHPSEPESLFKSKVTVPPAELGLDMVRKSIVVPRDLVVHLLGSLEMAKDKDQREELEILVAFLEVNDWRLSSDIYNSTMGLKDKEGSLKLGYRFDGIEISDMGISLNVHNEVEKHSYKATFDWSSPKVLRGEQPLTLTMANIVYLPMDAVK